MDDEATREFEVTEAVPAAPDLPVIRFSMIERPQRFESPPPPLTLVRAPTGFGKTAAVAHWAKQLVAADMGVLWLQAHESDAVDALGFISESLDGQGLPVPASAAACGARVRLEKQVAKLSTNTVLIIDNYERITQPSVDFALTELIERTPRLSLVAIAPRFATLDGPLVTSRLRTQIISVEDLAFRDTDVAALSRIYGVNDAEAVGSLIELTGGWPRAVHAVMASYAPHTGGEDDEITASGPDRYTAADQLTLLADNYLDLIGSDEARRVLLAISVCPGVSEHTLAETVLREADADPSSTAESLTATRQRIRELKDLGLLVQVGRPDALRFSCHPGMVSPLRHRATQHFTGEELQRLQRHHAEKLGDDDPLGAIRLQCELRDYAATEQLVARHLSEVIGTANDLGELLRHIPSEELTEYPAIASVRLVASIVDPLVSDEWIGGEIRGLHSSVTALFEEGRPSHEIINTASLLAAERMMNHHGRALEIARDLERRLSNLDDDSNTSISSRCFLHATIGFTALLNGEFELAHRNYQQALHLAEQSGNTLESIRALQGLALCEALEGRIFLMEEHFVRAGRLARIQARTGLRALTYEQTPLLAMRAAIQSDEVTFRRIRQEIEPVCQRLETWAIIVQAETKLNRAVRGPHGAIAVLKSRLVDQHRVVVPTPYLLTRLKVTLADLFMFLGDLSPAADQLKTISADSDEWRISAARLELMSGRPEQACRIFDTMPIGGLTTRQLCDYLLISAVAWWQLGSREDALADFRAAVSRMAAECGFNPLSTVPYESLRSLAEAAGESGAEVLEPVRQMPEPLRCEQFEQLSRAELRTLKALESGEPLEQTAVQLFISPNTLKFHLRSIYRKLRVSDREEAVRRAARMGLLGRGEPIVINGEGGVAGGNT
ncbi:MAG: LuxR C-terminal-related transcriptional regulator [Leucobacter sp.]